MEISFFTTLEPALVGAWIPSFAMVLIQFAYMFIYKEVGKRATDTSWYTLADKRNAIISSLLQVALLILSVFVPLKTGSAWFWIGAVIYVAAFAGFIKAFYDLRRPLRTKPHKAASTAYRAIRCISFISSAWRAFASPRRRCGYS